VTGWGRLFFLGALFVLGGAGCGPAVDSGGQAAGGKGREGARPAKKAENPWALEWQRGAGPTGEVVKIGAGMVAIGPMGGQARRYLFVEPERTPEILSFTRTYAPFRLRVEGGVLELRGQGAVRPGPEERRMIFEWARQVAAESGGVEPGSGYGLVLNWQRVSGSGCDEVAVYLSGEVRAGRCGERNAISGRLAPEPLAWLYSRFDRLAAFQAAAELGQVGMGPRLVFAGRGRQTASAEERGELEGFGTSLARELAPRRPPLPPEPAAGEKDARKKIRGAAGEGTPGTESPAGPRLLLPPLRIQPLPEVIIPDDRLPPPPPVPRREPGVGEPGG
jgi:hypothetical protein